MDKNIKEKSSRNKLATQHFSTQPLDKRNDKAGKESSNPESAEKTETINASGAVAVIVGKLAMPTTVLLVLITCISGYYLDEAKFTPVVGMIAPVVMALIMVIREASVGKDEDTTLLNIESERRERAEQYKHEKEIRLAEMQLDERLKDKDLEEHGRQFNMFHASNKAFLELVRESNSRMAKQVDKPHSTELAVGDTRIKIGSQGAKIIKQNNENS